MDHADLLAKYHYDPLTGIFTHLNPKGRGVKVGDKAGYVDTKGYNIITYKCKQYRAARVAWFYMTGKWPINEIDHKDTNPSNDVFSNLREATSTQQKINRNIRSDNTSGVKGVSYDKKRNKFEAYIFVNKKKVNLGVFNTKEEATLTRKLAEKTTYRDYAR